MYIDGKRIIITEFTLDMASDVQKNSVDEDNRKFVPDEVWDTVEEAEETLEYLIAQYGKSEGPFVYPVILKEAKENIGYVQLCSIKNNQWEIGYHIAKRNTGKGYATEAVQLFLPVIAKQMKIKEVYGICLVENAASIEVMKKCDFEFIYQGTDKYQGKERDVYKSVWRLSV